MSNLGPNYSSNVVDNNSIGVVAWTNPANAQGNPANDNAYAAIQVNGAISHRLWFTGFSFNIPVGAIINGVTVSFRKWKGGTVRAPRNYSIKLIVNGVVAGTDKSDGVTWATNPQWDTYGGVADLWGCTLTPEIINARNFGVALACDATTAMGLAASGRVDGGRITITYTDTSGRVIIMEEF